MDRSWEDSRHGAVPAQIISHAKVCTDATVPSSAATRSLRSRPR